MPIGLLLCIGCEAAGGEDQPFLSAALFRLRGVMQQQRSYVDFSYIR